MVNITIKAEYTTTEERMKFFANAKGWKEEISNPDYDESIEGSLENIPNPITLQQFLTNFTDNLLIEQISDPAIQQSLKDLNETKIQTIAAIKADIKTGLSVDIL